MWLIWLYWQTGLTKQRKDAFTMSWQLNKWQYVGIQQFSDNSIHDKSIYENDIFELEGIWGWEGVGQAEVPGACRKWRCPFCSSTVLIVRLSMHHRCSPPCCQHTWCRLGELRRRLLWMLFQQSLVVLLHEWGKRVCILEVKTALYRQPTM